MHVTKNARRQSEGDALLAVNHRELWEFCSVFRVAGRCGCYAPVHAAAALLLSNPLKSVIFIRRERERERERKKAGVDKKGLCTNPDKLREACLAAPQTQTESNHTDALNTHTPTRRGLWGTVTS